ncbi:hypothetical protein [Pseudomonas sp. VE 196-7]|uniref:hypothetical protein n=1 Tax=Pseudomonas sp. VE 196-7 TaxID=2956726 RepID=UPI0021D4C80E|nr:hypothetical protein [Pseudomonas sp. VE 196-7]MCU7217570.1 hypothetical protein [Pseudomonas sp. VE 196-7]
MLNGHGKELLKPWLSVQNVVLGVAVIFVTFLMIRTYELNRSEVASWVQAVGSVLAIIAAAIIASSQRREQLEREEVRKAVHMRTIRVLSWRARRAVAFQVNSALAIHSSANIISGLRLSFESLSLLDLPSPELVEPISTIRDALRALEIGLADAKINSSLTQYVRLQECNLWVALVESAGKVISLETEEKVDAD